MQKEEEKKEKETGSLEGDYWPPKRLDMPAFFLFKIKLFFLLVGFLCIGLELLSKISNNLL
ncbi:hypothetical protein DSCW_34690 [Desulfosarcina widdelii]|uniref:Uncharacterized protein n=1 Tax=Desulfosarcina widdelii TaxID=947919 RepID=A0A5K7Z233_9BACT|nr:hypothetical protein [Desulfosarcina widdelii]BBO76052.1 hypothetical protein DSCW_34690 [Desulfosarcina widdelii]